MHEEREREREQERAQICIPSKKRADSKVSNEPEKWANTISFRISIIENLCSRTAMVAASLPPGRLATYTAYVMDGMAGRLSAAAAVYWFYLRLNPVNWVIGFLSVAVPCSTGRRLMLSPTRCKNCRYRGGE